MCGVGAGSVIGTIPVALLVSKVGWRYATYSISLVGVVLSVLIFFIIGKGREPARATNSATNGALVLSALKVAVKNKAIWLAGLYGNLVEMPVTAIAELWGVPFLELRFGVGTSVAAVLSVVILVSFGLGGAVSPWIAQRIGSVKNVMLASAVAMATSFACAIYLENIEFYTCLILLFFTGICSGTNVLSYQMAYGYFPKECAGISAGLINTLVMSSGIVFQPLLGRALDFFRGGLVMKNGQPLYDLAMYRGAFRLIFLGICIAVVVPFFLKDEREKC
jgi:MFS family permease